MRLSVSANSQKNIGYTPDWLKITEKDGSELTLDIQGEINYDPDKLNCNVKGVLVPWTYVKDGKEVELYDLPKEVVEKDFSTGNIIKVIQDAASFCIGIYPCKDENCEEAETDVFTEQKASLEIWDDGKPFFHNFSFDVEVY